MFNGGQGFRARDGTHTTFTIPNVAEFLPGTVLSVGPLRWMVTVRSDLVQDIRGWKEPYRPFCQYAGGRECKSIPGFVGGRMRGSGKCTTVKLRSSRPVFNAAYSQKGHLVSLEDSRSPRPTQCNISQATTKPWPSWDRQ